MWWRVRTHEAVLQWGPTHTERSKEADVKDLSWCLPTDTPSCDPVHDPVKELTLWCTNTIPKTDEPKGQNLLDIIPDGAQAHNLPGPMKIFVAVIHLKVKSGYIIKTSFHTTSTVFNAPEKKLRQVVKGVTYESGLQKWKWELAQHDHDSSSLSDNDDSDNEEGPVAKIKPLKKRKRLK